jgi:hypothetical protein
MTHQESFNKKKYFNPQKNLHWQSFFTTNRLYSIEKYANELAELQPSYRNHEMFDRSVNFFETITDKERTEAQKRYFDLINHDQTATIFAAFEARQKVDLIRESSKIALTAMLSLVKENAISLGQPESFLGFLKKERPHSWQEAQSILETSLYNYSYFSKNTSLAHLAATAPLYAECGVDIMQSASGYHLAEFQFSYQTYPHTLDILYSASKRLFPNIFEAIPSGTYTSRRINLLHKFFESVAAYTSTAPDDINYCVIDAWAMSKHPMRNYKVLAQQLKASYFLFDDFYEEGKSYLTDISSKKITCLFNQPLAYFMDRHRLFTPILHERIEEYRHLHLEQLTEDYLNKNLFLTTPPLLDILNDKAIYALIPLATKYYTEAEYIMPISTPSILWDIQNPLLVDKSRIAALLADKDQYVICHRYLEAGDGVRIGKYMEDDEWRNFIETYVIEKPYLFIVREYIPMNPDISLRCFCSSLLYEGKHLFESSDTLLGRIAFDRSVAESSYFFQLYAL